MCVVTEKRPLVQLGDAEEEEKPAAVEDASLGINTEDEATSIAKPFTGECRV